MHNDSYQSDAYPRAGPLGDIPEVDSRRFHKLVGACVVATYDTRSHMSSTCVTPFGMTLIAETHKRWPCSPARKSLTG